MAESGLLLVVLGMMGRCPFGGQTWLYLNWLRGLMALGHDVWYVEDDTVWPYDPAANAVTDDCGYAVNHIRSCARRIGLAGRWVYRLADRKGACWGTSEAELDELYRSCDMLLNVGGVTALREEHLKAKFRVYVETDPVIEQLRIAGGGPENWNPFELHNAVVTYGENYGRPDCGVPLIARDYKKTRQPIDLNLWPMSFDSGAQFFTTIGNYRQNGNDVAYKGTIYRWSKHHEWEKVIDLPKHTRQQFELAMKVDNECDRTRLESYGWRVVSPVEMSLDIFGAYPAYFQRSRAEFTVAKDQNVRLRSGWFSERDACYLASGKPVVAQDTGFSKTLPTGEGLFGFHDQGEALEAIGKINADYPRHCRAARAIAQEYFEASTIARRLLHDLGVRQ